MQLVKIIGNSGAESFWYRFVIGETFEVKPCWNGGQLNDVEDVGEYEPEDFYIVVSGEFEHNVILKNDCKILADLSQLKKTRENKINQMQVLDYELRSSWWMSCVSNKYLQQIIAEYLAYKVKNKFARYEKSKHWESIMKSLIK